MVGSRSQRRRGKMVVAFSVQAAGGQVFSIEVAPGDEAIVGRDSELCDVCLLDPSVSYRHCRLSVIGGLAWVEDLDSKNGTFLNGQRVVQALLDKGDVVAIGDCRIAVGRAIGSDGAPVSLAS